MKSSFWVLCGVVLLCFGSARCKRQFSDNDDNFLDKTGEGDKIRTEKEEDSEWQLYKARTVRNDLTNEIDELSRMERSQNKGVEREEPIVDPTGDDDNKDDGTGDDGTGDDGTGDDGTGDDGTGDDGDGDDGTGGDGDGDDGTGGDGDGDDGTGGDGDGDDGTGGDGDGDDGKEDLCKDVDCLNDGNCKKDTGTCECNPGYTGKKCEELTQEECKQKKEKCHTSQGTCTTIDKGVNINCICPTDQEYTENDGCKDLCKDIECLNGGSCNKKTGKCDCSTGYTGEKCKELTKEECEQKMEKCHTSQGTCTTINKGVNIECICPTDQEYTENDGCKDLCKNVECSNGGTCNKKFGTCDCRPGYTGEKCKELTKEQCEQKKEKCHTSKGTCTTIDKGVNIDCICPTGQVYTDSDGCKDLCKDVECFNGGICNKKTGICGCSTGYTGEKCKELTKEQCEQKMEKCHTSQGTCTTIDKGVTIDCICPPGQGYTESDGCKDLCADFGCLNNGICEVENKQATCKCPDPFDGDKCQTNLCAELGCLNNGVCEVKNKNATCKCSDQFEGDKCQTDKCAGYCKNDGTCEIKNKKPTCKCKDDYAGKQCEQLTKAKCEEKLDICAKTNGTCIAENAEKITCMCRTDFAFDEEEGCKERDYCQEICGDNSGVKCIGDKKKKESVTCSCDDENEAFDKTDKECKTDYCKQKCGSVKCEGSRFVESEVQCKCTNADQDFIDTEKKCKTNFCRKVCGSGDHIKCEGDEYISKELKDCSCDDDEYLYIKGKKYCQKKCSDVSECKNGGTCEGKDEDSKLCKCLFGTTGDTCDVITACETGKYANCKGSRGECTFEEGKPICKCTDGKELYNALGYCEDQCKEDKSCEGKNRVCNKDNFCVCQDGYEGEDCSIVSGCKELKKKCDEIEVECVFNKDAPLKATCQCKNDYVYDPDTNKCKNPFCFPSDPCKKPAECSDDETTGIGFCKCPDATYYNYRTTSCENLADKCLLKKTSCGENEVCKNGKCECKYKKEGDECKPKLCTPNPCFANANCSESDGSCFCDAGKYFSNNKKCEKVKCSLTEYKTNCSCPSEMERKDGSSDCVPKKEEVKACDQDCGYGLCISKNKKNYCKCFTDIAGDDKGKCVLKSSFCAGGKLQDDKMKCKCEGQFTQADDGITCRLKTCEDDDVKKECASKGGVCKMQWKGKGYDCECPKGYLLGDGGKCTDPCSLENNIEACSKIGKFCYNSISSKNAGTFECGCPPGIKGDGCSAKAENAYIIKNIPVLKKEYETKSGINKVLLNVDLVKSMELTFSNALFESGYLYDYRVGDSVLNCSVWINFKREPSKVELNAMKLVPRTFSKLCDDCDDSAVVWPPSLLLSEKGLQEAVPNKLGFCSNEVKDLLCGKGAKCEKDKCTCDEGFKIIEYSIKEIASFKTQRCEDIDECALGIDVCSKNKNTICVNTFGSYKCVCKEGFKKKETPKDPETDKSDCYDMCSPSPCIKGKCHLKNKTFDCECQTGVTGSFCDRADEDYKSAKKGTVVVGAVLGTLLAVIVLGVLFYIIKKKKRSGSEDFMPAPRLDHAEMAERRGMRGVSNKAYE